ncbi:MAG: alkaline phosphatase family protein [Flavobacteriales bacterium]|nr:alkaline phosphatase family protein [Flavobacteriales bacterium]
MLPPAAIGRTYASVALMLCVSVLSAQRKVLIIGIDGCRPDALVAANAPVIDSLRNTGIYTLEGITHPPTWSGTGWSSMLTGVWEQKHGVVDNTFAGAHFDLWPHFMDRLKAAYPTMQIASIVHWGPINDEILANADLEQTYATDAEVTTAAVDLLTNGDPDVVFLQYDDVDHQGHLHGFDPSVPEYIAAIETVDAQVGALMGALASRPVGEEWLVAVTTDHGGNLAGHGGITPEEQRIFTILSSSLLHPKELKAVMDTATMGPTLAMNNTGYARVDNPMGYQFGITQDFTIECRVKMPMTWAGDPVMVANKNWANGSNAGFVISTTMSGPEWKFNVGDGADRVDLTGSPINDGQWHHLAVTCDRDGKVRIFQDGIYLRETNMAAIGNINTGLQLDIGQDGTGTYPTAFPGSIADVRIWNAALPIKTVSAWSGKIVDTSHPYWSSLIGEWRMDEGIGTTMANTVSGASGLVLLGIGPTWDAGMEELVTTDLSRTPTQVDLPPSIVKHLDLPLNPGWDWDGRSLIPIQGPISVHLRTLLQGPYDSGSQLMSDALRYFGWLPLTEPYSGLGFSQAGGGGGEDLPPIVLDQLGNDAIVDWVLVELRDPIDPVQIIATRDCLIQRDGDVVDIDGVSDPVFDVAQGSYYVAVRHRNHLGAMTAEAVPFLENTPPTIDLSDPGLPLYGTQAMVTIAGRRAQWAGEIKPDGQVKYTGFGNDRDRILQIIGGSIPTATATGYYVEDLNLDRQVKYAGFQNDRDLILQNIGGAVPTAVRPEQLP